MQIEIRITVSSLGEYQDALAALVAGGPLKSNSPQPSLDALSLPRDFVPLTPGVPLGAGLQPL